MESLPPQHVVDALTTLVNRVDEILQHDAHRVGVAMQAHAAFDKHDIDSRLVRALISGGVAEFAGEDFVVEEFALGGCEVRVAVDGVLYCFRFKRATMDRYGAMVVKVNADSALVHELPRPTLWDDEATLAAAEAETWIVAYMVHPETRTFTQVMLGRPVGVTGKSPLKVLFGTTTNIRLGSPTPPRFVGGQDDLDLGDEDYGSGAATA